MLLSILMQSRYRGMDGLGVGESRRLREQAVLEKGLPPT